MSRLVVVSNRVADPRKAAAAGGLAVALGEAFLSAVGFGLAGAAPSLKVAQRARVKFTPNTLAT